MIDRHHLETLRAVERYGSLTAAAEQLHLTQSALSHAMRKLEQRIGAPLWERDGRQLRFTPAGQYLLGLANRILPQFEHAEMLVSQMALGQRGSLRVGMECHPCYQWLLKVVGPYLEQWPDVDVDVKQEFQFGGMGALFSHDIDLLVTPDPLQKPGVHFESVFDYEQVLVVGPEHPLAGETVVAPEQLRGETLITYPVAVERLDIFTRFFLPAGVTPARHKVIETTDIMLQMVSAGRGVAALPAWLVAEYGRTIELRALRLGEAGIDKQIFLGFRERDAGIDYLDAFVQLAREIRWN